MIFKIVLAAALLSAGLTSAAHADCAKPAPGFDTAYCAAEAYADAAQSLNETYQALLEWLKPPDRVALLHEQEDWLARRRDKCETAAKGQIFVDYVCMAAWTRIRLAILQGRFGGGKRTKAAALATGTAFD
jgi:uncharacterized protein YecT (DUF1311 family)